MTKPDRFYATSPKEHSPEARLRTAAFEAAIAENVHIAIDGASDDPEERLFHAEALLRDAARAIQSKLQLLSSSSIKIVVEMVQDKDEPESFSCEAVARTSGRGRQVERRFPLFEAWLRQGAGSGQGALNIILQDWDFHSYQELRARLLEVTASVFFERNVREFRDAVKEMR